MYWAIKFIEGVPCISVSIGGLVTLTDIEALNAGIVSDSHWERGLGLLFDSTKVEYPKEPPIDMRAVADTVAKMNGEFKAKWRWSRRQMFSTGSRDSTRSCQSLAAVRRLVFSAMMLPRSIG
jgi:hypothetical protein